MLSGRRPLWVFWVAAVCFYITVKLCIISQSITTSLQDDITDVSPDVSVISTRQALASTAATTTVTTTTTTTTTTAAVPPVDCQTRHLGLPDDIIASCPETYAQVSCDKLLSEPAVVDDAMTGYMAWRKQAPVTDLDVVNLTANCTEFRRSRGFDRNHVHHHDDFPLAFNILAHRDADQVARLLQAIYRTHSVYCIHVDASASPNFQSAVRRLADCFDNVRLASTLESIVYAGFSRLQADITCMRDNLNSDVQWKYLINTAAQAFPLKTVEEMVKVRSHNVSVTDIMDGTTRPVI